MCFRWRPSFSLVWRPYAISLLPHWASLRSPFLLYKAFVWPLSLLLHPDSFLFLALPTLPHWNAFTERLVVPSSTASRLSLFHFSSLRCLYLPYQSPCIISLCLLVSGPFGSQPLFSFWAWPDLEWNRDSADPPGELLHPLTHSCFHFLALPLLLGTCLPSRWCPPFPPHVPTPISLSISSSVALA